MNKKEIVCYNTDASRLIGNASKVIFPKTVEAVQKVVQTSGLDIVPRGAGSQKMGGTIPDNSVVVDMSKMTLVSNFDPLKQTINVQVGITIRELNEKLNKIGFEFPIQPNNQGISSIGGMIAMNIPGNRSMKYGVMKEWIEEIEFINGRGELMKVSKSDLMDICGMEGITGIIVSATLKIIPKVKRSASLFQSDNLEEIFSIARRLKLEKEVCSLNLFSIKISGLLGLPEKYHLLIEFDSNRGKISGREYEVMTNLVDKVYYRLASEGYYDAEDPKFFFDKLEDFILFLESNKIPYFGKIGAGIIYSFFNENDEEKKQETIKMIARMGGKAGEYGIGLNRKYLKEGFERKIIQRVKLRHDPFCKLNKNKMIDVDFKKEVPNFEPVKKFDSKKRLEELRDVSVSHLESIKKEEIEEIKPLIEEEALELIEELKTPEEKMEEFIEKVELIDQSKDFEMDQDKLKIVEKPEIEKGLNFEIKSKLGDYESTYGSELKEERKKEVEDFAKNVARDILHSVGKSSLSTHVDEASIMAEEALKIADEASKISEEASMISRAAISAEEAVEKEEFLDKIEEENDRFKIDDPDVEKRGKLSKEDEDEINKVMFGS